ncbi:MAG: hypothetical protein R3C61_00960 [Bacteroidia bacterium]
MVTNLFLKPGTVLRMAVFTLLLGRGWQFFLSGNPFHIWQQNHPSASWIITAIGLYCLAGAAMAWLVNPGKKLLYAIISGSSAILLLMTWVLWEGSRFEFAQLIEQTAQWATPLLLLYFLSFHAGKSFSFPPERLMIIVSALVFTGHGLYASGIYAQPGHFHFMITRILGISGAPASHFLHVAGVMDFIVSIGVFFPKVRRLCLMYMVIWGTLTALARVVAYTEVNDLAGTLILWLPQTVFRLPHGLLPLAALRAQKSDL